MIKIVLIICILLLIILYLKKNQENLFYDENTYQTLQIQERILDELQNKYDEDISEEDKITELKDCRANTLYKMKF